MLTIACLFIWVLIAPRSIFFINPYLEKELSGINTKFKVKIEGSIIKWDRQQHSVSLYANNIRVLNDTNDTVAILPELSFGFSLMRLLSGHILSSDITLTNPSIYLNTSSNILYVTSEKIAPINAAIFTSLRSTLSSNDYSFKIRSIRLKDAKIFISTSDMDMMWRVDDGYAKLEKSNGRRRIKSEFKINFGKDSTYFEVIAENNKDKSITTDIHFKDLPSYMIGDMFPDYQIEQKIKMSFSGGAKVFFSNEGAINGINIDINSEEGVVKLPECFKENIDIDYLSLSARFYDNLTRLAIDNMELDSAGPSLKVSGSINNIGKWPDIIPSIDLNAEIYDLGAREIDNYWPLPLGKVAREWVVENIKTGTIPMAQGKFRFSSDDIKNIIEYHNALDKPNISPIPDGAIDATINIENANLTYMPKYPQVEDVDAVVKFTSQSMEADIKSAKTLNTNATNAHVKFNNLWDTPLKISIDGDFAGDAQDIIHFLKLSYQEQPSNSTMASIYNINGNTEGHINLSIPITPVLKYSDAEIKISSKLHDSFLKGIITGRDVLVNNILFKLDKYDFSAVGDVSINNIPTTINLRKNLANPAQEDLELNIKGNFSPAEIKELSLVNIPYVTGKIGLDADIKINGDSTTILAVADLVQSEIKIENIGFAKPSGIKGVAEFNILKSGNENIDIKEFSLHGDGFLLKGNAKISPDLKTIAEVSINNAQFATSDFVANYKSSAAANNITISGKGLDLSQAKLSDFFRKDNGRMNKALTLNINLDKLYMKNGEILSKFTSDLRCSAKTCANGNLMAKIRQGNFLKASLRNIGDRASLTAQSDNAGAIINAFNISKNINGGLLFIDSSLAINNNVTVTQGIIRITDFTAIKTPLLGKVLTLASFRGFEDLLNNEGISFKKFEAPFVMQNGIIKVTKAKSSGASIGLTADGKIDTMLDDVDLKGVIVPAYAVNNALGKIPFVGKIIIGKENEGIIATKYSLKGSYDDTKVSVNPLSILTPGFIRNIFDIFE